MTDRQALMIEDERLSTMVGLLETERGLYERLSQLARRKQDVLVHGRLPDLELILEEEKAALATIADIEEERYALQCGLAREFGLQPSDLTVSRLANMAGPVYGPRLRESQQSLVRLINELSAINQCNAELIQQSLAYINFTMDLLVGGSTPSYGERGGRGALRARPLNRPV